MYQFNEKDKTLRVFLRGRPIVHHTPDDYRPGISQRLLPPDLGFMIGGLWIRDYDSDSRKKETQAPEPSTQLDLDWVYGYRGKGTDTNLITVNYHY